MSLSSSPGRSAQFFTPYAQFSAFDPEKIRSHPGVRSDLFKRPLDRVLVTDFLGGVAHAEIIDVPVLTSPPPKSNEITTGELGMGEVLGSRTANESVHAWEQEVEIPEKALLHNKNSWWTRSIQVLASQTIVVGLVGYVLSKAKRT
jgi:GPI-anchor transamidase subunit K